MVGATVGLAQPRYSANFVGYYDADFVAGSNLVANPFDAGNNTISNLFAGVPSGSFFIPWNQLNFAAGLGPTNFYSSASGWTDGAVALVRPFGGFLWLPEPKRISFAGQVWPRMCVPFPPGLSVSGVLPFHRCGFCASFDCPAEFLEGTMVIRWDRQNQRWDTSEYSIDLGWYPAPPILAPDEAAVVQFSESGFLAQSPGFYPPSSVSLIHPRRVGENLVFQFLSTTAVGYSIQRAASLDADSWRTVASETGSPIEGVITVTVPAGTGPAAFYRMFALRLTRPSRTGSQFQFQFYAEDGVTYHVGRSATLLSGSWQEVQTIEGKGAIVTATDASATGVTGYYRVEY
jgi:hypothetical protein